MKLKTLIQKAIELEEDYGDYDVIVDGREIEDLAVYHRRVEIETKRKVEIGYVGDRD